MFEMSDTSRELSEPNEPLRGSRTESGSFQTDPENTEMTPLTPATESALTHRPETYEPRAYTESRELPAEQAEATSEPVLERPTHIAILSGHNEPLSQEAAQDYMSRRTIQLPRQALITPDEKHIIDGVRDGFKALALEAGVDISGNAPDRVAQDYDAYHPYDKLEDMQRDVRHTHHVSDQLIHGMQQPSAGVVYSRDIFPLPNKIARLTVQDMSRHVVVMGGAPLMHADLPHGTVRDIDGLARYASDHGTLVWKGDALNEAALDVTSARLGHGPWRSYPSTGSYRELAAAVIDETVRRQGMTPKEMEDALVRGMVTDDHTLEEAIKDSFGAEGLERVLGIGTYTEEYESVRTANALGVGGLVQAIHERLRRPGHTDIYPWRNPR